MEEINWIGHASFFFVDKNGNKIYFIDPFQLKSNLKPAAIIFITHAHPDHFSPKDIEKILKENTTIVAPKDILEKIEIEETRKVAVLPNQKYEVPGFSFETIPAYNNSPEKLKFHPKEKNWIGYIFNLNGQKVYHAGDTDFIDEMKKLKDLNLDIAMLPIGGTYTMEVEEAARATNAISARITIPMHYKNILGGDYKKAEDKFKVLVTNSKVEILEELT